MEVPHHKRIEDPLLRRAVDLLDAGDAPALRALLQRYPDLVRRKAVFEPGYFHNPTLLAFCAENPIRHGRLPPTIVEATRVILEAGADAEAIQYTLALVCSGRIARECNAQLPLIDLLCDYGAIPDRAVQAAVAHDEFAAVEALLQRGAALDLPTTAATGRYLEARSLLPQAGPEARQKALAFAAQHGRTDVVRLLLDAGEDPNRYNPPFCHEHSTPLHQAVWAGHLDVVRLLVERGARTDLPDKMFEGTALGWAEHGKQVRIVEYLRSL